MFDACVGSILNYACEVWGNTKSKEIERIHLKFCKRLLTVKQNTCNAAVYGELGRHPLFINRFIRIVKYCLKISNSDNIIIKSVYLQALQDSHKGHINWVTNVKRLLDTYGFSQAFDDVNLVDVNLFMPPFEEKGVYSFRTVRQAVGLSHFSCPLSNSNSFHSIFTKLGQKLYPDNI